MAEGPCRGTARRPPRRHSGSTRAALEWEGAFVRGNTTMGIKNVGAAVYAGARHPRAGKGFVASAVLCVAVCAGLVRAADPPPGAPGAPPAATTTYVEGQKVEVREGDTWSAATILKREGRK